MGILPNALVLLDTHLPHRIPLKMMHALRRGWWEWYPSIPRLDNELTAMSSYLGLFESWTPETIAAPILFVRATEAVTAGNTDDMPDPLSDGDWRSHWEPPHAIAKVPGNHFTMMEKHADTTAQIVHEWLTALPPADGGIHRLDGVTLER
jgi:hypothetical protein